MKAKDFHIYALVNFRTLDAYIGYTGQSPGQRQSRHIKDLIDGAHHSPKLQDAWNEYGSDCFGFVIVFWLGAVTRELAEMVEQVCIERLGTYNEQIDGWSDGMRATRGKYAAEMWSHPDRRLRHSRRLKEIWADPVQRQAYEARRTRWEDPAEKAKHSVTMKALWADPERRARLKARNAARWADPEAKARQSAKMRAAHERRRAALVGRFKVSDEDHTGR